MNTLRDEIEILRISNENSLGRNFVPEAKLFMLLTEAKIRACLREMNIADHEREEMVHAIMHGARRCFSILLLLNGGERITGFFKHDLMQKSNPDDRFPYTTEPLQRALGIDPPPAFIKRFMNMQWCFMVPVLRSHSILRELDKSTVLPYVREKLLGSGAMGDAYLVDLHPECHELPIIKHQVVRKELKQSADEDIESFMRELKNVALLAHLKHPNIVKLYCSYVQDMPSRRCNFIFEVAEGGSLAGLLDGRYEGPPLEAHQLLWGLADLASAVDTVHNFVSDTLDLELTGCHHDLKPQNILIQGETLVLIDFGLSTFRNPNEDSLTLFKETRGSYIAPECQSSIEGRVKSHKVGRASDIWSFGCVLSEVLTFLICGSAGVQQFRNKRVILFTEGIEWSRFHVGPGRPNSAVSQWLRYLEEKGSRESWTGHLIKLIRWTLTLDPKQRPKSSQVLRTMSWIATIALSGFVSRSWEGVCRSMPSSKLCILESYRFSSWSHTLAQLPSALDDPGVDFKSIQKTLKGEQDILNSIRGCDYTTNIPLLRAISKLNTSLVQALPFEYKTQFKKHLVDQVLQIEDMNELGNISIAFKEGPDHDVGTLIAMQRLIFLVDQGNLTDHKGLVLEEAAVTIRRDLGIHSLAKLQGEHKDVIVEWLRYDGSWADKSVSSRLLKGLSTMASLLSDKTTQSLTGTLQCQGYFHEPARNCFGLVYLIPATDLTPRTLYQLVDEMVPEKKKPRFRPPLEYRFRLAKDLCRSVQALHKINWLHRNIHSMNVICLSPPGVRDAEAAQDMRLMGLGASREDTHDSFTQGHDEEAQLRNYQHPSYLGGASYRVEFDCYSLGLVLLEIGLWSTLSRLGKGFKGMDDEAFRRNIIQKYVTQLEMTMGSNYMEAVRWCIECEPASIPQQGSQAQSLEEMVMDRLHIL